MFDLMIHTMTSFAIITYLHLMIRNKGVILAIVLLLGFSKEIFLDSYISFGDLTGDILGCLMGFLCFRIK